MKPEKYWIARAWARMLDIELMGNDYATRLIRLYLRTAAQIEDDMLRLFRRYRDQGSLSNEEAAALLKEPIDRATWELLRQQIDLVQDETERRRMMAELNAGSVRTRLDRQQALLLDLQARCAQLAEQEVELHTEAYTQTAEESHLRTVFDTLQEAADKTGEPVAAPAAVMLPAPRDTVDRLLAERWSGKNFSARIWDNTDKLAKRIEEIVRTNMTTGRSWRRCLDEMATYAATPGQGALYAAQRLLRTEQNYMANQMTLQALKEMGVKHYRFIATLDIRTSEICQLHDGRKDPDTGKPYEVAKAVPGKNMPPLHPNCRSVIAAIVEGETLEGMKRAARDPVTGKSAPVNAEMTYPEWLRSVLCQPDIPNTIKEKLLGGKNKRILFDAGVLEPEDYSTPWKTLEERGIIVPGDSVVNHSTIGVFSDPSKEYRLGRLTAGGHGQSGYEELVKRNFTPEVLETCANGVRFGNVPSHENTQKKKKGMQSWFPTAWSDYDIHLAGAYVANRGMSVEPKYGTAKEAIVNGVNVRVNWKADGRMDTICPSFNQPLEEGGE